MRVAPIGLYFGDNKVSSEEADRIGAETAALTHGHELGYLPAAALVHIINLISHDDEISLLSAVKDSITSVRRMFASATHLSDFIGIMEKAIELSQKDIDDLDAIREIGQGWVAEETLAIAVYCSLKYENDFDKAVIAAVNHSGDSDSTGAVTGNILGAFLGLSRIPQKYKDKLELYDVILEIADDLYNDCKITEYGSYRDEIWEQKYIYKTYTPTKKIYVQPHKVFSADKRRTTTMAVRDQIDRIIANRKEKSEALQKRKTAMQEIKNLLRNSGSALVMQTRDIQDEQLRSQYGTIFSSINTMPAQKRVDQLIRKLDEGIKRFDRDYISIATVGKEGQGKSQFLQSVGDLDNSIIPAYDGTSCTGATSIIWNDPNISRGGVKTVITFRQPQELLDIVTPYIKAIDPSYLEGGPLQFEDVGYINLSQLRIKMIQGDANQATAMKHLTNIVEHFDEFCDLFGASPLTLTDPELIKTYVAQNNGRSIDDPNAEFYYKYLAVARADIYCPFFTDTGKVRLVDTVGIGATQYGIEGMMLNTVDRECDAAIVVTRPDRSLQEIDIALYNSLRERFAKRDTSQWLFYLVNHFKGRNDNVVGAFHDDIRKANWAVADCRIVDASDQAAVRDNFVMPMLQTLLKNMDAIDSAYLSEIDELEQAVRAEIRKLLDNMPALQSINTNALLGKEAAEKGKQCFNRMANDLKKAVHYWSQEKEKPNTALWNSVQAILNNIDNIIPTPEKINALAESSGATTGESNWEMVLHYVRNTITDRFIAIDNVLEKETLEFKNSLVKTLYHELRQLSVDGEQNVPEEECDMVQWLKTMMDGILSSNEQYIQIRKGFNFLYHFEFNTRAQLIQEVRRQMYIINPICAEYAKPSYTFPAMDCGNAIHFYLTSRMSVIEDELRYHLAKLYRTPNLAFYAAAEEFYDRLAFASDLSGDSIVSMSDVWGAFFQEYSSKLWKEDTERFDVVNQLIGSYNQLIVSLEEFLGGNNA